VRTVHPNLGFLWFSGRFKEISRKHIDLLANELTDLFANCSLLSKAKCDYARMDEGELDVMKGLID
jgi:predicted metal-binding protein